MAGSGSNQNPGKDQPFISPSRLPDEAKARPRILVIEDSKTDLFLIREAIETAGIEADVDVFQDGYAATEYLVSVDADDTAPCPDVILLDLNLPKKSGHEVLRRIETGSRCRSAKVLIVSSSDAASDRALVDMFGVSGYFKKPSNYDDFMKLGPMVSGLLNSGRA